MAAPGLGCSWSRMTALDHNEQILTGYTCGKCGHVEDRTIREIGWDPLKSCWRCPDCSRVYRAKLQQAAEDLILLPDRSWLGKQEHRGYDECWDCDVKRAATWMLLKAPA